MPRRYYFPPTSKGSILGDIGQGLERGAENLTQGLEQRRQAERQQLFDELEIDEFLLRNRGGRGEAPTRDTEIKSYAPTPRSEAPKFMPDAPQAHGRTGWVPRNRAPGPGGVDKDPYGFMPPAPKFEPPKDWMSGSDVGMTVSGPDPRYRNVGGGLGYVMTPDAIEDEDHQRALGREADARAGMIERLGPAADALTGGLAPGDPGFGEAALTMHADDIDPYSFMTPGAKGDEWRPTTRDDAYRFYGRDPGTGRSVDPTSTGGARDGRMTEQQALEYLQSRYAILDEEGYATGYSMSEGEMLQLARDIAAGRDVNLPQSGGGAGGGGGGGGQGDREAGVLELRRDLEQYPRRQWRKILEDSGASDELIAEVLMPRTPNTFKR